MRYDIVPSTFERAYAVVTEASFSIIDDPTLKLRDKDLIYRKVLLIREYLEECENIWNEIESFGNL